MSALRCRPLAALLLVVFLGGCYTWEPIDVPWLSPERAVRITLSDGSTLELEEPWIDGDSIRGRALVTPQDDSAGPRQRTALRDTLAAVSVESARFAIEGRHLHQRRVTVISVVAAVGVAAFFALSLRGGGEPQEPRGPG